LRLFTGARTAAISRPGVIGFILLLLVVAAAWFIGANGEHTFPFVWVTLGIGAVWAFLEMLRVSAIQAWTPAIVTFAAFLATYLCISPNGGVPKYNLSQQLTQPSPLDPRRLYLSVYPAPEHAYRLEKRPQPFGTTLRPGSTSMWAGIHLINGYSPIGPAGVSREFAFAIHGEIRPDIGNKLLEHESASDGILARLGIDGIIVANEDAIDPQPETEWELEAATGEGRVFHRRGGPFPSMRSVTAIDSRPNEQFVSGEISRIVNGRNRLEADVAVPADARPALLTFSRPFFNGYQAKIGDRSLKINSYRGLIPVIEIPAGTKGRLEMIYRPWWLVWGGAIGVLSMLVMLSSVLAAVMTRRQLTQ
jgi:hypothetical protein